MEIGAERATKGVGFVAALRGRKPSVLTLSAPTSYFAVRPVLSASTESGVVCYVGSGNRLVGSPPSILSGVLVMIHSGVLLLFKVEVQVEDGYELSAVTQERPDKKKRVSWDAPQRREKITDGRDDGRVCVVHWAAKSVPAEIPRSCRLSWVSWFMLIASLIILRLSILIVGAVTFLTYFRRSQPSVCRFRSPFVGVDPCSPATLIAGRALRYLLLLLRPKDILKRRPSLLTATSHRRSQCSSSRGGAPHLSAPSPPSSALLLLPQPLLPQLPPTATLNLLIIVSCDALLLCTKVLISRGRPSTPSGRSPCFTASPLPPTAAPKLDSGGAPGGDRGLPRRPLQGSSTQISHLSTMAALMPFTVCCPPLLPYFLRQSATRLRSARRGDLYFFFLLQSCTWLEQISPVVRSPLLPSTAPHPTVPCDGGFFLRRPSPTPLLLLCRCPLTPSSAPAILNRRRGALPCQMTVLSVREISFLRCQMAANPTAPGCMS
ncbi:hypothetical protein GW17_00044147 [Ensete ventricosum]|nr:hypothetical protein GW17_00044147 [Ensete ventricosum]